MFVTVMVTMAELDPAERIGGRHLDHVGRLATLVVQLRPLADHDLAGAAVDL